MREQHWLFKYRTGDITTNDRLEGDHLGLLDKHRTAIEDILIFPDFFGHLVDIGRHEVCRDDMLQFFEPKQRDLREDFALVWYAL